MESGSSPLNLDAEKVRALVEAENAVRSRGVFPMFMQAFLFMVLVTTLPVIILALTGRGWSELLAFLRWKPLLTFGPVVGAGVMAAVLAVWSRRRGAPRDEAAAIAALQRRWASLTSRGWPLRTLAIGLLLGAGVGIPVGIVFASDLRPHELPPGGRAVAVAGFLGMTLLWTIPFAFGMRLLEMRRYRKLELRGP